ncbi:CbiM family transporter [Candidatus Hydrogenedentota bacterium]
MHISDGILHPAVLVAGYGACAGLTACGLRKLRHRDYPLVGIVTSSFFVASLVHMPFGPTGIHLQLNSVVGLVLGVRCFPAFAVAILLQAVLLHHGGITTVGVNMVMFSVPAYLMGSLMRYGLRTKMRGIIPFAAGSLTVLGTALIMFVVLAFCPLAKTAQRDAFVNIAYFVFIAHVPVMVIEGIIAGLVVRYIQKVMPDVL